MGPEMLDIIKLSTLAIGLTFIGGLMKKADKELEFKFISIIGLGFIIYVVGTYVMQFFSTIETMLTF